MPHRGTDESGPPRSPRPPRRQALPGAEGCDARGRVPWARLVSASMVLSVWLPILVIGGLHYCVSSHHHWIHDILRRLYYLPIVLAAFPCGLRGGLLAALLTVASYVPHAFFLHRHHDPAPGIEKALEILLYFAVGGVSGYLADLERKRRTQLRDALQEQQRLAEQLIRAGRLGALGELVAGVAHELKNPLHALAGTAEIVDPLIPGEAPERRMWDLHVAEIERLGRVAERFLSFARPAPLDEGPVDLRDVARRLLELLAADARRKNIDITIELPSAPVIVLGDRDQLAQVALNIAVNAFDAMRETGGRMRVAVLPADREGARGHGLRIENDGPRIPAGELERLFDPFHSGSDEGSGLGLAISARIADLHGGHIEAANEGLGVAFTLRLPPAPDAAGARATARR